MPRTTHTSIVRLSLAAVAACMLPWFALAQQAGWRVHELNANTITLPPSDPGILSALPCGTCAVLSFNTTIDTRYEIGTEKVTLEEMRRQFAAHPRAFVVVSVGDDLRTVRRVSMSAASLVR
jgi:hypothetical protein